MAPHIIAVLGSPRPAGNTAKLLKEAVRGAEDAGCSVEMISVYELEYRGCREIFHCMDHDTCRIQDDMIGMYEKFREMDGLIVAAPIMTMGIPGPLKSFLDRFQVYYMAKYYRKESFISGESRKKRRMLFISIGGMDVPYDFDGAKLTMKAFGEIIDCPYYDEVLQNGMDRIRDITTRPEVMRAAYEKGAAICRRAGGCE
ncbi:MAG: flavodoxin family protein [Methanoculleaceae archaeon]